MKKPSAYQKTWTEEEDDFLVEYGGFRSLSNLAKKLKRTEKGVLRRMEKLQIADKHFLSGTCSAHQLGQALGIDSKMVVDWIRKQGLPANQGSHYLATVTEYTPRRYQRYFINVEHFWEWAETHRHVLNWSKVEKNTLPPEPDWLEEQRKVDAKKARHVRKKWTPEEDEVLWNYFYREQLTQKEIGQRMGRTREGIEKRLMRLREKRLVRV